MFYNVVVDEWGGTTYVPTTLGNVLLRSPLRGCMRKSSKKIRILACAAPEAAD